MQSNLKTVENGTGEILEVENIKEEGMPILSETVSQIVPALCKTRMEMAAVDANGWNQFHGYKYKKADDIYTSIGAALAQNGIMVIPSLLGWNVTVVETQQDGRIKKQFLTTVKLAIMMLHGSGESITQFYVGTALDTGDKGQYKAYTGCLKYHLLMTFLIGGDDAEDDGKGDKGGGGNDGTGQQGSHRGRNGSGSRSASNGKGQPGKVDDTPKITANQVECLKGLIKEAGFEEKQILTHYKLQKLTDLPVAAYEGVVKYLEKVKEKKASSKSANEGDSSETCGTTSNAVISLQQVKDLEKLLVETGTDQSRFLQFLNVETLDKMPVDRYDEAVKSLEAKKNKKGNSANDLISALTERNISFQIDEENGEIHANPDMRDAGAKAFLSQLGFKAGFGGKPWIKKTK